jgi:transposase-like protein
MISNGIILGKIVEENSANPDFSQMLSSMCHENLKLTKKLAKIFLKEFNGNSNEKIALYLKAVKKFLLIKDSLQ